MLYDVDSPDYLRFAAPKRYAAWQRSRKIIGRGLACEIKVVCYSA